VRSGAGDRRRQFRSVEERPRGTCWSVVCVQLLVCFRLQSRCIGSHLILIAGRRPLASFGATTRAVVFFLARPVSFFWLVEIDRIEWCPCVTQKGGKDQNGVTGPRDPSEVSTTRELEESTPNESRVFLFVQCTLLFIFDFVARPGREQINVWDATEVEVIGKPPTVWPLCFFVVPCSAVVPRSSPP
jgi:hypothetical protein